MSGTKCDEVTMRPDDVRLLIELATIGHHANIVDGVYFSAEQMVKTGNLLQRIVDDVAARMV